MKFTVMVLKLQQQQVRCTKMKQFQLAQHTAIQSKQSVLAEMFQMQVKHL